METLPLETFLDATLTSLGSVTSDEPLPLDAEQPIGGRGAYVAAAAVYKDSSSERGGVLCDDSDKGRATKDHWALCYGKGSDACC